MLFVVIACFLKPLYSQIFALHTNLYRHIEGFLAAFVIASLVLLHFSLWFPLLCREQDYAFIDGEQASQFMCPITSDLLLKPHQTRCCGKIISEAALNRLETNQCPFCKEKEITTTLDKHFQRQVREIQVFCSYRKSGCEWTGEVSSLPAHINSCPKKNSPSIQQLGRCECRFVYAFFYFF